MKLYISADMEGTTGIAAWDETTKGSAYYNAFAEQMSREVAAVCTGASASGKFDEIFIKDAHDSARNIIPSLLPQNIKIMRGWNNTPLVMMAGVDYGMDAAAFTGYHSNGFSDGNPLSHTMSTSLNYIKVNGEIISEFHLNAYTAGYFNVPVIFISGDENICKKAKKLIPAITTVPVNTGDGPASISISPALALEKLRQGIIEASGNLGNCRVPMPESFKIEICYHNHANAKRAAYYPGAYQVCDMSAGYKSDDYMDILKFIMFCA